MLIISVNTLTMVEMLATLVLFKKDYQHGMRDNDFSCTLTFPRLVCYDRDDSYTTMAWSLSIEIF